MKGILTDVMELTGGSHLIIPMTLSVHVRHQDAGQLKMPFLYSSLPAPYFY